PLHDHARSPPIHALLPLLCERSCVHLDLHSFPTRRSSDLASRVFTLFSLSDCAPAPCCITAPCVGSLIFYCQPATLAGQHVPSLDRKSTRLNSSHVKISYAAFCLKKTNTKRRYAPCSPARQ